MDEEKNKQPLPQRAFPSSNRRISMTTSPDVFRTAPRAGGFLKILVPPRTTTLQIHAEKEEEKVIRSPSRCQILRGLRSLHGKGYSQGQSLKQPKKISEFSETESSEVQVPNYPLQDIESTNEVNGATSELGASDAEISNMMGIVISTVMILAHGEFECPNDHMLWTEHVLGTIKDDQGNIPPNVGGFLRYMNHIRSKKGGSDGKPTIKNKEVEAGNTESESD